MANSSLLDKPAIRERATRFSVEQYHLLGEAGLLGKNVELLEGFLVDKMPKSPLHTSTTESLTERLRAVMPAGCVVRQEQPLTLRDSEPEPDVALVQGERVQYRHSHPVTAMLILEVAVTSAESDHQKQGLYAGAGVGEYWIVLPEEQRVEVHTRPLGREYGTKRVYIVPEMVVSETLPTFCLDLATFFSS